MRVRFGPIDRRTDRDTGWCLLTGRQDFDRELTVERDIERPGLAALRPMTAAPAFGTLAR
jgi:hypothetical protein